MARVSIVHKQRVSRQFGRECNRLALAGSEATTQILTPLNWSLYVQPFGCAPPASSSPGLESVVD